MADDLTAVTKLAQRETKVVRATESLSDAAETVGLRFLDHVIVTEAAWARAP